MNDYKNESNKMYRLRELACEDLRLMRVGTAKQRRDN